VGEFKNDKGHGKGELKWKNGDRYVGKYENDKTHGEGVFYWKDGRSEK
jgi:hypothetical protein